MKHGNDGSYNSNHIDNLASQLLKLPLGHHYLILYPNINAIRKVYSEYINVAIKENNVAILFLPYYDTTDNARNELITKGLDVKKYERDNSITLIDFAKVVDNPYLGIPAAFGLKEFINKIQTYHKNKNLIVIADMSLYYHSKHINDLLRFESIPHDVYSRENWKQLCLYHRLDFDLMFTHEQKRRIIDCHKGKIITVY